MESTSHDLSPYITQIPLCSDIRLTRPAQINHLDGFERFTAMGSLFLSQNRIAIDELRKLQHMTILHLTLFDNPAEDELHCAVSYCDPGGSHASQTGAM